MSIDKFISKVQKSLQAYVNLSVSLQDMTLVPGLYQPELKNLALKKITELKKKEDIISLLKEYIGSLLEEDKSNDFNSDHQFKRQKDFFFLSYFLELVILTHGEDFVLVELMGQSPLKQTLSLGEKIKKFLGKIFNYQKTAKVTQKIVSTNDESFSGDLKQFIGGIKNRKDIITEDRSKGVLIENEFLTWAMIYEMAKHLNPTSLLGLKPDTSQVIANSDFSYVSGSDSLESDRFKSGYKSRNYLNVSSCEESRFNSKSSEYSDSSCSDSLTSPLLLEESRQRTKRKVTKKELSARTKRHYARYQNLGNESRGNTSDRHLDSGLKEKLKKCLERKEVYEKLYKRYESYKDNNQLCEEELTDYKFKFSLNHDLYNLYENYIKKEEEILSKIELDSYLVKLLKYYEFKYLINKYKLDKYKAHIQDIESDVRPVKYTLKKLGYYKEKCDKIYTPRLKNYQLLIEETRKKINTVPNFIENKVSVEDGAATGTGSANTFPGPLAKAPQPETPPPTAPGTGSGNTSAQPVQAPPPPPPEGKATTQQSESLNDELKRKIRGREERTNNNKSPETDTTNPEDSSRSAPPSLPPPTASGTESGNTSAQPVQGNGAPPPPPPPGASPQGAGTEGASSRPKGGEERVVLVDHLEAIRNANGEPSALVKKAREAKKNEKQALPEGQVPKPSLPTKPLDPTGILGSMARSPMLQTEDDKSVLDEAAVKKITSREEKMCYSDDDFSDAENRKTSCQM